MGRGRFNRIGMWAEHLPPKELLPSVPSETSGFIRLSQPGIDVEPAPSPLCLVNIYRLRERTHLPVIVDPSHAAGERDLVPPLARAAKAVGAQGIMIEIHPEPEKALSDGPQALRFPQFQALMAELFS